LNVPVPKYYRSKMTDFGGKPAIGPDFWLGTVVPHLCPALSFITSLHPPSFGPLPQSTHQE